MHIDSGDVTIASDNAGVSGVSGDMTLKTDKSTDGDSCFVSIGTGYSVGGGAGDITVYMWATARTSLEL